MDKLNFNDKQVGDKLLHTEWNALANKTDEIVDALNNGGADGPVRNVTFIETGDGMTVKSEGSGVGIEAYASEDGEVSLEFEGDITVSSGS